MKLTCTKFVKCERSTLKGFAEISFADLGMIIRDIAIHAKGRSAWAQPPAKPWVRDGVLAKDGDGKVLYVPIFDFTSKENRSRILSGGNCCRRCDTQRQAGTRDRGSIAGSIRQA